MLTRFFLLVILWAAITSCSTQAGGKKTVKPRFHRGYYKKHIYHKTPHVGRIHFRLFEKQGVKTVKKN
jgi:hypothetical protein